ncbi:MAG: transposase [Proteobacteria bacterium]|nr:transposase [Pseudomonadota bacterium]MBU4472512.1 transposase [Pseudomonadota bacterium]
MGRYTHRVAISTHRIISLENGKVTFGYRNQGNPLPGSGGIHPAVHAAYPSIRVYEDPELRVPGQWV